MRPATLAWVWDSDGYTHRPMNDPGTETTGVGTQESVELHLRERDDVEVAGGRKRIQRNPS